jgi:hypothetical protein
MTSTQKYKVATMHIVTANRDIAWKRPATRQQGALYPFFLGKIRPSPGAMPPFQPFA